MINITKYLTRYYGEEDIFAVYEFSDNLVIGTSYLQLIGGNLKLYYDDEGVITELEVILGNLTDINNNDLIYSISELNLRFKDIQYLPTYKLKNIKGKCIIKHNASTTFHFF